MVVSCCFRYNKINKDSSCLAALPGARDGTISVWQPPPSISARIRSLLEESLEVRWRFEEWVPRGHLTPQRQSQLMKVWMVPTTRNKDQTNEHK